MPSLRSFRTSSLQAVLFILLATANPVSAQIAFKPAGCDFQAVFVSSPDIKEAVMPDGNRTLQKSAIATLGVVLDGKSNLFRAECMIVAIPERIDDALLLEDMKDIAKGNSIKNPQTWIEKGSLGLVGRIRGEIADSTTKYIVDIHRFIGSRSVFDVWVGSPPGTFPSEGNLIFLKEVRLNGQRVY